MLDSSRKWEQRKSLRVHSVCTAPQTLNFSFPLPQLFISKYTAVYIGQLHTHVCSPQAEEAENTGLCSTTNRSSPAAADGDAQPRAPPPRCPSPPPAGEERSALPALPLLSRDRGGPLSPREARSGGGTKGFTPLPAASSLSSPKAGARKRETHFPRHGHLFPLQQAKAPRSPFVTVPIPPPIPGIHNQAPFPSPALLPAAAGPGRSERVGGHPGAAGPRQGRGGGSGGPYLCGHGAARLAAGRSASAPCKAGPMQMGRVVGGTSPPLGPPPPPPAAPTCCCLPRWPRPPRPGGTWRRRGLPAGVASGSGPQPHYPARRRALPPRTPGGRRGGRRGGIAPPRHGPSRGTAAALAARRPPAPPQRSEGRAEPRWEGRRGGGRGQRWRGGGGERRVTLRRGRGDRRSAAPSP